MNASLLLHILALIATIFIIATAVDAQLPTFTTSTTTTKTRPPWCQTCNYTCQGTDEPLTSDFVFRVNIHPNLFSRASFRNNVGYKLVYNRYALLDKEIKDGSFSFGFTPNYAIRLTSNKVCAGLEEDFLFRNWACCLRNYTEPIITQSPEDLAAQEEASHRNQLIACWVSIVGGMVYLAIQAKKQSGAKDYAMESAMDLATQRDDDEM